MKLLFVLLIFCVYPTSNYAGIYFEKKIKSQRMNGTIKLHWQGLKTRVIRANSSSDRRSENFDRIRDYETFLQTTLNHKKKEFSTLNFKRYVKAKLEANLAIKNIRNMSKGKSGKTDKTKQIAGFECDLYVSENYGRSSSDCLIHYSKLGISKEQFNFLEKARYTNPIDINMEIDVNGMINLEKIRYDVKKKILDSTETITLFKTNNIEESVFLIPKNYKKL